MTDLKEKIKKAPSLPGVYIFFNSQKEIIYIGKATSLKSRIRSYFSFKSGSRPIERMINEVKEIKWKKTDTIIEALILEANLIKKYYPKYNVEGKDDRSWNYLVLTKEDYPKLEAIRGNVLKTMDKKQFLNIFGPYVGLKTKEMIRILHHLFKISKCSPLAKRPCFDYQIGNCLGVCAGELSKEDYFKKVINPLGMFLKGKKKRLISSLNKQMKIEAKRENFEEARRLRNQISNLEKIQDVALINKSFLDNIDLSSIKIEAYDISNLGKDSKVGSMVVFNSLGPVKKDYKRFKIKTIEGQSDVDCLSEVIERRVRHKEWPWPDVFVVDGGKAQVNVFKKALGRNACIVGIAKGKSRKKNEFIVSCKEPWILENKNLLLFARDEAHRFAVAYQRKLSKGKLFNK